MRPDFGSLACGFQAGSDAAAGAVTAPGPERRPGLADIHASASQAASKGLVPEEHLGGWLAIKRLSLWREAIEYGDPQVIVALDGDKVVGFAGFGRSRDKGTSGTTGEVWAIYAALRSGIGGLALWGGACEALLEEGCTRVTV